MRYFKTADGAKYFVVFERGDLLLESLREFLQQEGIANAVVTAGIGALDRCQLHWITGTQVPATNEFVTLEGPLEVASIQGNVVDGEPHIHLCLSDLKRIYTGHLEAGSRVCYRCEICVEPLVGLNLTCRRSPTTGVLEVVAKEE
ncbi:MAG: PPC domain-containing DNA-binding protein [Chloroflexota bacterium]